MTVRRWLLVLTVDTEHDPTVEPADELTNDHLTRMAYGFLSAFDRGTVRDRPRPDWHRGPETPVVDVRESGIAEDLLDLVAELDAERHSLVALESDLTEVQRQTLATVTHAWSRLRAIVVNGGFEISDEETS